ncbi:MAG: hypothetical protein KDD66_00475 [Bdellovibrionales bacterium]|nr:hypothetical protein [Bdellovibrionales bacterium]
MQKAVVISRNRSLLRDFKRIADASGMYSSVDMYDNLDSVGSALVSGGKYDVVFIDETFDNIAFASFIENAKRTQGAKLARFVLLCDDKHRDREIIANGMMAGFHAFLSKPFNVKTLEEIAALADKVHGKGTKHRLRAATGLLLSEIIHDTGEQAPRPLNLWKEVESSCDWYKKVTGESVTLTVVDPLHQVPAVERVKHYKGVSERVRNLIKERLKTLFLPS